LENDMTKATKTTKPSKDVSRASVLADEVRESARTGQRAAGDALRRFRDTVDEVIPEVVEPLRTRIVDAAIELADALLAAQFEFSRSIVRTADHALSKPRQDATGEAVDAANVRA
jgi:hypothetical protein